MVKKKKKGGGLASVIYEVSPELQAVLGKKKINATELMKLLWKYIHKHKLNDGQTIYLDEGLQAVYGKKKTISMLKLNNKIMREKHMTRVA